MMQIEERADSTDPIVIHQFGPAAVVVINRPDDNNAINDEVRDGLIRALDKIEHDPATAVVVLTGAGDEAFSVGADIVQLATLTPPEAKIMAEKQKLVCERLSNLSKPIIVAIKGACIGAGFELALHCDIRFARADARFGLPGVNVGLVPGGSAVGRLSQLIGAGPARALCLTGGVISAERAFMLGLVTNVIQPDEFRPTVEQLVEHLCTLSPVALAELKGLLNRSLEGGLQAASDAGPESLERCFRDGDAMERLQTLFGGPDPEATVH